LREQVTDRFVVQDEQGNRHQVVEKTRYETGRALDGGETPAGTTYQLSNGTYLESDIGGDHFFSRNPHASYERVK